MPSGLMILGAAMILACLFDPRLTVHRVVAGNSLGSGVSVASANGQTLILTAQHVVQDGGPYTVAGQTARVIATDKTWDLAALVVDDVMPISRLGNRIPRIGDNLTVCGYGSNKYSEIAGQVVKFFSPGGNYPNDFVAITAKARSGDSGGPLFYSDGTVCAVLFGSDNVGAHGSHCLRIRKFLSEIKGYDKLLKALDREYVIYGS
jgi:S1-C subfamily serine protease